MSDWMENFRPVRQRTVRSETTKDKAGSLPPAVYSQPKQKKNIPQATPDGPRIIQRLAGYRSNIEDYLEAPS